MHDRPIMRLAPLIALVLSSVAFAANAGEPSIRRYVLPEHGALELKVPSDWSDIVRRRPDAPAPPTIVFGTAAGLPFEISVTPAWKSTAALTDDSLKQDVQRYLDGIKPNAVETDVTVEKFDGAFGPGFYFSITDKAPRPSDYKFLTHGAFKSGELIVSFTILTYDGQEQIVRDALAMLRTAKHTGQP